MNLSLLLQVFWLIFLVVRSVLTQLQQLHPRPVHVLGRKGDS